MTTMLTTTTFRDEFSSVLEKRTCNVRFTLAQGTSAVVLHRIDYVATPEDIDSVTMVIHEGPTYVISVVKTITHADLSFDLHGVIEYSLPEAAAA